MEDLVLVARLSKSEQAKKSMGRPMREGFCLRKYSNICVVAVPGHLVVEGHRADFYVSSSGFGLKLSQDGSRALSGRKSARTVSVPIAMKGHFDHLKSGTYEISGRIVNDDIWFFPFSQLEKSE